MVLGCQTLDGRSALPAPADEFLYEGREDAGTGHGLFQFNDFTQVPQAVYNGLSTVVTGCCCHGLPIAVYAGQDRSLESPAVFQHPVVCGLYSLGKPALISIVEQEDFAVFYPVGVLLEPFLVRHLSCHLLRELDSAGGVHILTLHVQPATQLEQHTRLSSAALADESDSTGTVRMPVENRFEVSSDFLGDAVGVEDVVIAAYPVIPVLLALLLPVGLGLGRFPSFVAGCADICLQGLAVGKLGHLRLEWLVAGLAGGLGRVFPHDSEVGCDAQNPPPVS
jgi:hypothetical protein